MLLTLLGLGALFGLLQNPYWVPSGDSEFYIAIARDMARGLGYQWNGQPVAMSPPGWPLVMAAVMKISPYFLPLKLMTMSCMIGALICAYWIIVRFVSPQKATFVILLTATLTYVYQSTFWLISESLFCLVSIGALLLAFQIREGRRQWWRIALVVLLAGAAVSVRWAGVLSALPIVAALFDRDDVFERLKHWATNLSKVLRSDRCLQSAILVCAFTLFSFFALRFATKPPAGSDSVVLAATASGEEDEEGDATVVTDPAATQGTTLPASGPASPPFTGMDKQGTTSYKLLTETTAGKGYDDRLLGWGKWFSWLFWQPFRAAAGSVLIEGLASVVGWMVICLLMVVSWTGLLERRWIWPAVTAYSLALAMLWPVANARYLVPVAFLIALGAINAIELLKTQRFWWSIWLGMAAVFGLYAVFPFHLFPSLQVHPPDGVPPMIACLIMATVTGLPRAIELWKHESQEPLRLLLLRLSLITFVGITLLTNLTLWAVDVYVARSGDFYADYEAGINQNLIAAARYINSDPAVRDGQIVVTPEYSNLNRKRSSLFGLRATVLLTGKSVISLPAKWRKYPPGSKLSRFMNLYDMKYYIHQTPVSPWRVWHFRVAWWQVMRTGDVPDVDVPSGWELWRFDELGTMTQIQLEPSSNWPTRVPGL